MKNFRLKYGMFWKRSYPNPLSDYPSETRTFLLICILLLAVIVFNKHWSLWEETATNWLLQQSYWNMITMCANGDCRFQAGDELFELKGGSLGSSELVRSVK